MIDVVLSKIEKANVKIVIFDIDGTLKDLCKEHSEALKDTLEDLNVGKVRKNIVKVLNILAMNLVKSGLVPANKTKQEILTCTFSLISLRRPKEFLKKYYACYKSKLFLFPEAKKLLEEVNRTHNVYFSTTNKQNYNLERCGIFQEQIIYATGLFKIRSLSMLLKRLDVKKENVMIVGDNIFDDIMSAKILGVKSLLVNNYESKFKNLVCNMLNKKYLK